MWNRKSAWRIIAENFSNLVNDILRNERNSANSKQDKFKEIHDKYITGKFYQPIKEEKHQFYTISSKK